MSPIDPLSMLKPRRKVRGISAILLPFTETDEIDWEGFASHVARTDAAGLTPAVNMDTGYVNLLSTAIQDQILAETNRVLAGKPFVAGAFVSDRPGEGFQLDAYLNRIDAIQSHGGTPIIFQSYGLTSGPGFEIVSRYSQLGKRCNQFLGFELTRELAAFGAIYDLDTFSGLMSIRHCIGLKHSSFQREPEWQRLQRRDAERPDFYLYTGNDFAIDMIAYGSDYLLGLSTFAPDLFAVRDRYWETGDSRFYELNDLLQYLGRFAFRSPSPGYKHSAAQFLKLRGWIKSDRPHPQSAHRPNSDIEILREIAQRLNVLADA